MFVIAHGRYSASSISRASSLRAWRSGGCAPGGGLVWAADEHELATQWDPLQVAVGTVRDESPASERVLTGRQCVWNCGNPVLMADCREPGREGQAAGSFLLLGRGDANTRGPSASPGSPYHSSVPPEYGKGYAKLFITVIMKVHTAS